jgi:hypothetical protein
MVIPNDIFPLKVFNQSNSKTDQKFDLSSIFSNYSMQLFVVSTVKVNLEIIILVLELF